MAQLENRVDKNDNRLFIYDHDDINHFKTSDIDDITNRLNILFDEIHNLNFVFLPNIKKILLENIKIIYHDEQGESAFNFLNAANKELEDIKQKLPKSPGEYKMSPFAENKSNKEKSLVSSTYCVNQEILMLNDLTLPTDFVISYINESININDIQKIIETPIVSNDFTMLITINTIAEDVEKKYNEMLLKQIKIGDNLYLYYDKYFTSKMVELDQLSVTNHPEARRMRREVLIKILSYIKIMENTFQN